MENGRILETCPPGPRDSPSLKWALFFFYDTPCPSLRNPDETCLVRMSCDVSDGYFYRSVGSTTAEAVQYYVQNSQRNHWMSHDYEIRAQEEAQARLTDF